MLILGVLGEGWGAGGFQEGGLADLALDIHGLNVLLMLSVIVHEKQCLSIRGSVPVSWLMVSSQVPSASSRMSGNPKRCGEVQQPREGTYRGEEVT